VADDVRQMVAAGRYPPGTRLPSVRRLADEYGLAPQTVQNALRVLREEGRAYFVRDPDRPVGGTTAGDGQLRERLELVEAGLRELQGRVAALEADRH
jgi:GntR family transcriptional regulator